MGMKHMVFFLLVVINLSMFAQARTYSVSLFYDIDQTESVDRFQRLDSLYKTLSNNKYAVQILAYADFLSNETYNLALSQRRANRVKSYLLSKRQGPDLIVVSCEGYGEKESSPSESPVGEPFQRRVDVLVKEQFTTKKIGDRENIIHRDTTVHIKPKSSSSNEKKMEELEQGETITLEGLNFIPGRHVPVQSSLPVLEKLLQTMKEHPQLKIEIQGHICCIYEGEDGFDYDTRDMHLSTNRALTVYNYLTKNGISKERMRYKGYGRTQPKIEIERTPEDEQANRRVDIKILEN